MEKLVYGICYGSETVFVCFGDMRQALFIVGHSFCHGRLREWVITLKFHGLPKVLTILRGKLIRTHEYLVIVYLHLRTVVCRSTNGIEDYCLLILILIMN